METTVKAVMTTDVVTVHGQAPYKKIVEVLRHGHVNAVPVLDAQGRVAGVVSTTDLIMKEADPAPDEEITILSTPRRHREHRKAGGTTAAELMSAPARTVTPDTTVQAAAQQMRKHRIGRLPVTDPATGALLGIVSRSDVLRVYERPDEEIERDVRSEITGQAIGPEVQNLKVTVSQGRVEVHGEVDLRSRIPALMHRIRRVEGVISAYSYLEWHTDDLITGYYPFM